MSMTFHSSSRSTHTTTKTTLNANATSMLEGGKEVAVGHQYELFVWYVHFASGSVDDAGAGQSSSCGCCCNVIGTECCHATATASIPTICRMDAVPTAATIATVWDLHRHPPLVVSSYSKPQEIILRSPVRMV